MSNSSFEKIHNQINIHFCITDFYMLNLVLIVNKRLHLVKKGNRLIAFRKLGFLFNFTDNPQKALEVITRMNSLMTSWSKVTCMKNEDEDYYFMLMRECVKHNFRNDNNSWLYVESLINDIRKQLRLRTSSHNKHD